ncbi:MAG: hypothetical protein ACO398_11390 [Kiritimatiellia bacterium]|jgi:hypothetical protein
MTSDTVIEIRAPGVDTAAIMEDIRATVARKAEDGVYDDTRIAKAERTNLINLRDDANFLSFYLAALREGAVVDINDFDIRERRARFSGLLIRLKKTIWSLLKFYTFRLWSQQNSVNGLLVTGLESLHEQQQKKIAELEARIASLEKKLEER